MRKVAGYSVLVTEDTGLKWVHSRFFVNQKKAAIKDRRYQVMHVVARVVYPPHNTSDQRHILQKMGNTPV